MCRFITWPGWPRRVLTWSTRFSIAWQIHRPPTQKKERNRLKPNSTIAQLQETSVSLSYCLHHHHPSPQPRLAYPHWRAQRVSTLQRNGKNPMKIVQCDVHDSATAPTYPSQTPKGESVRREKPKNKKRAKLESRPQKRHLHLRLLSRCQVLRDCLPSPLLAAVTKNSKKCQIRG